MLRTLSDIPNVCTDARTSILVQWVPELRSNFWAFIAENETPWRGHMPKYESWQYYRYQVIP